MALTPEQATEVWELFGNTSLFSKWPEARNELVYRLDVSELKAGTRVFEPGDLPECLYLVSSGIVRQMVRRDHPMTGPVWLELRHAAGDYFGQHALFARSHESSAVVVEDARLYRMGPIDLRMAMERDPELRNELLRENLASRLRRIPLFRSLGDDEVRWLAQAIEEASFSQGTDLPLNDQPGLWIIEWGHIAVTGPANLYESLYGPGIGQESQASSTVGGGQPWRLTAGNLFMSPATEPSVRSSCTAQTAKAELETRTFYLASEHVKRLVSVFGDVREILSKPLDIANDLLGVRDREQAQLSAVEALMATGTIQAFEPSRLFSGPSMGLEHFRHLAQFCGWEFVPAGQNITTQGSAGHCLVILRDGAAVVHAVDDSGKLRPRNTLRPGDYYGRTSLLEGRPRDASVRAVKAPEQANRSGPGGAEVIVLDRRDLQCAFTERPDLWHAGIPLFDRSVHVQGGKRAYEWQGEGETVLWHSRAHWLFLLLPELGAVAAFAALFVILSLISRRVPSLQSGFTTMDLLLIVAWGVTGSIIAINYFIDYYVVTNLRVTHRDRQLLVYDVRTETPMDMVQDVNIAQLLVGKVFGFGDLEVRSAAKTGSVLFAKVPDPSYVQSLILTERARAAGAQRGQQKEILRRQLIDGLHVALPILERVRALGPNVHSPSRQGLSFDLPRFEWGTPRGYTRGPGDVVWRKTWVNLLQRAGLQALIVALLLFILILGVEGGLFKTGILGLEGSALLLAWFFVFALAVFWLWYRVMDWRNDIYVVTDDKLIDIEAKPLALSYQRREGNLDRVQTAYAEQKGFWANVLDYGNVLILTAAADPGFTFSMVGHPKRVQAVIFEKLDAFRRRQEEQRTRESHRQLIEGLEAYHDLREGR